MFNFYNKTRTVNVKYGIVLLMLIATITFVSACKKQEQNNLKSEPDTCNNNYYKKILGGDSSLSFLKVIEHSPNHLLLYNQAYTELTELDSFFSIKWRKTYQVGAHGINNYLFEKADSGNYFLAVSEIVDSSIIFKLDGNGNQLAWVKTLRNVNRLQSGELISYQTPAIINNSIRIFEVYKFDMNLNLIWHYGDTTIEAHKTFSEGIGDLYFASEKDFVYTLNSPKSTAHILKISKDGVVKWEKDYKANSTSTNKIIKTIENADMTLSLFIIDGDYKCYKVITDSSGNIISTTFGNPPNSTYNIIQEYGINKFELESSYNGCRLKKYVNNSQQWQNDYKLNVETTAREILLSATGSIYIIGTVQLYDGINNWPYQKPFVIKTNALGKTCFE